MPARRSELQVKATVTDALTQNYLKKLSRQNYIATAIFIFIAVFSLLWLFFRIGGTIFLARATVLVFFSNSMYALASFIGATWCFQTAYRVRRGPVRLEPRQQRAWLLIGLGLLANGIGGAIYTYLEDYVRRNPVPSPADAFFTLTYILVFIGLLMIPPKTRQSLKLIMLDALITTLCILDISWFFIIRPIFFSYADLGQFYVAASYPFWDILLVLAIVLLIYQRTEPILTPSLIICGLGIFAQIGADTLYAITIPAHTYNTGTWYIDTFWFIGYLLIGLSAPYQYAHIARHAYREREHPEARTNSSAYASINQAGEARERSFLLSSSLIYIPILILIIIIIYSEFAHIQNIFLIIVACLIGILLTTRFILSNYENERLLSERDRRRAQADLLRLLTAQLAEEIQLDSLLTRIVTIATTALGFDTAALLLTKTYDQPQDTQFSLLVRAASDVFDSITTWQFEGEQLPFCPILSGKQVEVYWPQNSVKIPEELEQWQKEQYVVSTLFVPLVTQGKNMGCLALSSRTRHNFDESQAYLANAFAEQAARTIEHARLYEEAREHELFAQALAIMAARLNSAVASGTGVGAEIHQLICTEAARALQADYAILYMPAQNKLLLPVAVSCHSQEIGSLVSDWPPIRSHTPEAQMLNLPHPELMPIDDMSTSGYLSAVTGPLPALPVSGALQSLSSTQPMRVQAGGLRERKMISLRGVLKRRYARTAIFAPLIVGKQGVALLVLARSIPPDAQPKRSFTRTNLAQAQDFAEQAAIAFTNAQLYQQIREAHRQLQELDRLKDQFMVTASHELRTPLTSIQGYLELLAQFGDVMPPEQQQEFLQKARRGCDELVLLLSNVMDASRLEVEAGIRPANLEGVSIHEVVTDVITLIEPQVHQENREALIYIPDHFMVRADPGRLRQVMLNLCTNAMKYSSPGTPLAFTARAYYAQRPSAIIGVSDKGKGIKPEDQAQVFQRFVRLESDLNSPVRGSGLGLYISRRLVEAMDGRIWVESTGTPGAGSTFYIQLPLA
ncbi:MAG TPA: ATP-binding protein [Ktedonobacteraceae bacterium]|nr:ATP-binding protein [Ktedonobacteraceae bacterium]